MARNISIAFGLLLVIGCVAPCLGSFSKTATRKKRYVAFPEGSSVSGALCLTMGVIGNPHTDYLSYALNWGVAYDLPNETWVRQHAHGFKDDPQHARHVVQRRSRREVYEKIAATLNDMGIDGSACIARALCESSRNRQGNGRGRGNMIEEILRTMFSLPQQRVRAHEPEAVRHYDRIFRRAPRELSDCSLEYPLCRLSLLELAQGTYSVENADEAGLHQARYGLEAVRASFM